MRAAVLAAVVIFGVATLAFATIPQLQFAYSRAPLRIALETAASLIALLASFLVYGRLRRYSRLPELLLACALAMLALVNLCLLVIPMLPGPPRDDLMAWVLLTGRTLAALLFVLAAFGPRRRLPRPGLALAASIAAGSIVVLLVPAILTGIAGGDAHRLAAALAPGPPGRPGPGGHPVLFTLQLTAAAAYGAATIGFLRRSRRLSDEFLGWLAISGFLAGLSHLNYAFYPSPYTGLIRAGDIFRLCFYVTLLAGSMREIRSYWLALSQAAVLEERQRIAGDLHDGLAQELACLARNLDSLSAGKDGGAGNDGDDGNDGNAEQTLDVLRGAVRRAQLESRRAVSALAASCPGPIEVAVAEAAAEVSQRFQIGLQLDLACGVKVSAARQDAMVRIAREAVANAARHSGAGHVHLELEGDGPRLRLRVSDRGRGFDPGAVSGGFGLVSMRQRARSVGGDLRISSAPGLGSEVEATL